MNMTPALIQILDIASGVIIVGVLIVAAIAVTHWVFTSGGGGRRGRRR